MVKNQEEELLSFLTLTEKRSVAEAEKTHGFFQEYQKEMESRFAQVFEENRELSLALGSAISREREIDLVHKAEIEALRGQVVALEETVANMRIEMVDTAKRAEERVTATIQSQEAALKIAINAGRLQEEASCRALKAQLQQKEQQLASIRCNLQGLFRGIQGQMEHWKHMERDWYSGYSALKQDAAARAAAMIETMIQNIEDPRQEVRTFPQYSDCSVM